MEEINIDLSSLGSIDFDINANVDDPIETRKRENGRKCQKFCENNEKVRCVKIEQKTRYRRAASELNLLDAADGEIAPGDAIMFLTHGDVDGLSYLKYILRQQKLDYCLLSTWCMANDDILLLREYLVDGLIGRLDCYVGEIFTGSYRGEYELLKQVMKQHSNGGRVCAFRNHSKVFAGKGNKFSFAVHTSANINTNPRTENGIIVASEEAFIFHKVFFDGIKAFSKDDFNEWEPWHDHGLK